MHLLRLSLLFMLLAPGLAPAADAPRHAALSGSRTPNTTLRHYATIADGIAGPAAKEYGARPGHAVFSMKAWASSTAEAAHMARLFAKRAGFSMRGPVEVYTTAKVTSPNRGERYGYDIKFYPYDPNKKD